MAINCIVVELSPNDSHAAPKDLLPWADPYIAMLLYRHEEQMASQGDLDDIAWRQLTGEALPPIGDTAPANRISRRGRSN